MDDDVNEEEAVDVSPPGDWLLAWWPPLLRLTALERIDWLAGWFAVLNDEVDEVDDDTADTDESPDFELLT